MSVEEKEGSREEKEGCRGAEGRRGDIGPLRWQRVVEGTDGHGVRGHRTVEGTDGRRSGRGP
jgi:hypothetical protein